MWRIRRLLGNWWFGFKLRRGWAQRGRSLVFKGEAKPTAELLARHLRKNPETGEYEEIDRRVAHGKVTDVLVADVVDKLQAAAYINTYKYHDSGTGINAEAAGDTALQIPTGIARVAGTQEEGASANIYKTVATITYNGTYAITEHGVFDAATAGKLMDRTVFAAIGVDSGDKIEFTYQWTLPSGG